METAPHSKRHLQAVDTMILCYGHISDGKEDVAKELLANFIASWVDFAKSNPPCDSAFLESIISRLKQYPELAQCIDEFSRKTDADLANDVAEIERMLDELSD